MTQPPAFSLARAQRVYKICTADEWRAAVARGVYEGSSDDARDGYVHLSTSKQAPGVLERFFAGRSDLVLVAFDSGALGALLRWETNGADIYPHLYGPLRVELAIAVLPIPEDAHARRNFLERLT